MAIDPNRIVEAHLSREAASLSRADIGGLREFSLSIRGVQESLDGAIRQIPPASPIKDELVAAVMSAKKVLERATSNISSTAEKAMPFPPEFVKFASSFASRLRAALVDQKGVALSKEVVPYGHNAATRFQVNVTVAGLGAPFVLYTVVGEGKGSDVIRITHAPGGRIPPVFSETDPISPVVKTPQEAVNWVVNLLAERDFKGLKNPPSRAVFKIPPASVLGDLVEALNLIARSRGDSDYHEAQVDRTALEKGGPLSVSYRTSRIRDRSSYGDDDVEESEAEERAAARAAAKKALQPFEAYFDKVFVDASEKRWVDVEVTFKK